MEKKKKKSVNFFTHTKKIEFRFYSGVKYSILTVFTFVIHCIYFHISLSPQASKTPSTCMAAGISAVIFFGDPHLVSASTALQGCGTGAGGNAVGVGHRLWIPGQSSANCPQSRHGSEKISSQEAAPELAAILPEKQLKKHDGKIWYQFADG